ncbi:hypothetical protein COLO4_28105 [Corchorus olitorius]|uniref:Uncharacterized protein n=1 Tax=Corchorus olitorius TaxID=93759 RepID=A0A1R3HMY9_9ROSI|nr:hypothetical protein COLO4_28105 [Corchorus olitorius]
MALKRSMVLAAPCGVMALEPPSSIPVRENLNVWSTSDVKESGWYVLWSVNYSAERRQMKGGVGGVAGTVNAGERRCLK